MMSAASRYSARFSSPLANRNSVKVMGSICIKLTLPTGKVCGFKKLPVLFVFIKVEICRVFVAAPAEFFQNPGLAHLTHAFQNEN